MARINGAYLADIFTQEVPTGVVNGINVTFNVSSKPVSNGSVLVYLNGIIQRQAIDYNISGLVLTFVTAPSLAQKLYCTYIKDRE